MRGLRLWLGTAVIVAVSVFLVLDTTAEHHPVLHVRNVADGPLTLYAEVAGQRRELGELAAGRARGFRVRADAQRVFGARFADGETVLSGPLFLTVGQQTHYRVARKGWELETAASPP